MKIEFNEHLRFISMLEDLILYTVDDWLLDKRFFPDDDKSLSEELIIKTEAEYLNNLYSLNDKHEIKKYIIKIYSDFDRIRKSLFLQLPPELDRGQDLEDLVYSDILEMDNGLNLIQVIQYIKRVKEIFNEFILKQGGDGILKTPQVIENPFPRIFINGNSYMLFQKLKENVRKNVPAADLGFIYGRMKKDGLILKGVAEREFRDFLSSNYTIELDKIKSLEYYTTELKESNYKILKDLFKPL
jgi:hypothetical protein